jgi:glycosyltransferase involved in cell wall biosynthesis
MNHLVVVQYGDYAEGYERLRSGGRENYYAQRYTVEYFSSLASRLGRITIVTFSGDRPRTVLANGVHTVGLELYPRGRKPRYKELVDLIAALHPDGLVVISPILPLLRWTRDRNVATLPMFMDSFRSRRLKARFDNWRIGRLLGQIHFPWVANHGTSAAEDLVRIGVPAEKTLAFDWPAVDDPAKRRAKQLDLSRPFRLVYVGQISTIKGVWDLINAVDQLNSRYPQKYTLSIFGKDQGEDLASRAASLTHADSIHFMGLIPHDAVIDAMHEYDAVVVSSRHEYPEGIPMTIFESFCSRAPLIASDHPMFERKLIDGSNCIKFKAGSIADLSRKIQMLSTDPDTYRKLSDATMQAADNHLLPLKYHMLLDEWMRDPTTSNGHLAKHSLAFQNR